MAQDLEPNDSQDTAVGTLPLGPKGYAIESLSGTVQPPDRMLGTPAEPVSSSDPRDFYRVNYTGGVTSVNVVSLGNWDARQSIDGNETIELRLNSTMGSLYVQVAYLGDNTYYEYYDDEQHTYVQVDTAAQIKLPEFEVPRGGSNFIAEVVGYRLIDSQATELDYDITLIFSGFVTPNEFNDELYGDDGVDNTIHLLAGDDTYYGLSGNDTIYGERGNDTLDGGKGEDLLDGGVGKDKMRGGAGNDTYWVDDTDDVVDESLSGSGGIDLVKSSVTFTLPDKVENLALVGLSIDAVGNDLKNTITGTTRDNKLSGRGGNDWLDGRSGNDTIRGDGGNDTLIGGKGSDKLYGGAGSDRFVFTALSDSTAKGSGRDTIYDFAKGDRFDLSALDASSKRGGNQSFSFIGTEKFGGHAGELRFEKGKSDTYIYADTNGDKKADFAFHTDDAVKLVKADFLL